MTTVTSAINQNPDNNKVFDDKKRVFLKKTIKVIIKIVILCVISLIVFGLSYPIFFDQWMDGTQVWYSFGYVIVRYPVIGENVKIYPIPYEYLLTHDPSDWSLMLGCENLWNRYEAPSRGMTFWEYKMTLPPYTGPNGLLEQWEQWEQWEQKHNK